MLVSRQEDATIEDLQRRDAILSLGVMRHAVDRGDLTGPALGKNPLGRSQAAISDRDSTGVGDT